MRSIILKSGLAALVSWCAAGTAAAQFCGFPLAGGCCSANGTPYCNEPVCCNAVCAQDPFCCDTEWDGLCAGLANDICAICDGCCAANGSPGCNDGECEDAVCAVDPFCCDTQWDGLCADQAEVICATCGGADCGGSGAGNCYESNGTPGCNDADCCAVVCQADPFCCDNTWDGLCADQAFELCGDCGGAGAGNCFDANGSPGCDDAACCELVCVQDPFCCNVTWDGICADAAVDLCTDCGTAAAGNCCASNGTPGCSSLACCEIVCSADPFCCEVSWDGICADAAQDDCNVCDTGACCIDGDCQILTPAACAAQDGEYQGDGVACGPSTCPIVIPSGACCLPNGNCIQTLLITCVFQGGSFQGEGTLCADVDCSCVGDLDGDGDADSADLNILLGDFGCGASDCCAANGTPGCSNAVCQAQVCAADPFCCDVQWDSICADAANDVCGVCGDCEGDLDDDGDADSADLNILLGAFGCGT